MAVNHAAHYSEMEKELTVLLKDLVLWLTPEALAEASEFLAAREYGLAFEEIVGALVDGQLLGAAGRQNRGLIERMTSLAQKMEIKNRPLIEALERAHA